MFRVIGHASGRGSCRGNKYVCVCCTANLLLKTILFNFYTFVSVSDIDGNIGTTLNLFVSSKMQDIDHGLFKV